MLICCNDTPNGLVKKLVQPYWMFPELVPSFQNFVSNSSSWIYVFMSNWDFTCWFFESKTNDFFASIAGGVLPVSFRDEP